jgi:hypothetical protein
MLQYRLMRDGQLESPRHVGKGAAPVTTLDPRASRTLWRDV